MNKLKDIEILEKLPKGWQIIDNKCVGGGYVWANNKKSLFGGEYKHALIKKEEVKNNGN
jgi:hypothetical protein